MSLFPRTSADWTRAFAYPLFAACWLLFFTTFFGGWFGGPTWRYLGQPLSWEALPLFGVGLASSCWTGRGLNKKFRRAGLILAGVCVVLGPGLRPALAY
jgi:hypothetical protein